MTVEESFRYLMQLHNEFDLEQLRVHFNRCAARGATHISASECRTLVLPYVACGWVEMIGPDRWRVTSKPKQ